MAFAADFVPFFETTTRSGAGHARAYLCGLFQGQRSRKNIERMEEVVPGLNYQGVQQFITDSPWESAPLMEEVAAQADGFLGGASDSRLIIDDSGFAKKGEMSVGVGRQYNGNLGKTDNCQVAVFASLSAGRLVAPVGTRLYLPKDWCADAARCEKAGIPEAAREFRTKPELALALVAEARTRGLRFEMVCVDGGYGQNPGFLRALDEAGETFVAEVHCDQRIYTSEPWPEVPAGSDKPARRRVQHGGTALRIDQWVAGLAEHEWERCKIRDSTQGWIEVNCVARRMWIWDGREEQARLWWVLAWQNPDEGQQARIHYALSNAGADADAHRLISHGVHRYWVERGFQDAKSEAGMGDYQTRGWRAWHHHMALVMLMMLFILREKVLHAARTPELPLSAGDIVFVLSLMLPARTKDFEEVCSMVEVRRRKRLTDQRRRRDKTKRERPPLGPLEDLTK